MDFPASEVRQYCSSGFWVEGKEISRSGEYDQRTDICRGIEQPILEKNTDILMDWKRDRPIKTITMGAFQ
jgi:hypothetical protein